MTRSQRKSRVDKVVLRELYRLLQTERLRVTREYQSRPREFLERYGVRFVPVTADLFDTLYFDRKRRVCAVAPRGGGKTFLAASLVFALWFFKRYNAAVVAGSKEQAQRLLEYVQDFTGEVSTDLGEEEWHETKTLVKDKTYGHWIKAVPASHKAVRGLHARGRGMILVLDEEAEMDDDLVKAALRIVRDARPALVLRISTAHKVAGTFAELIEQPGKFGYLKFHWDGFDVARVDRWKGTEPDWDFYFRPYQGAYAPEEIQQMIQKIREYWNRKPRQKVEGWIPVEEIVQSFVESDQATFEVEDMGFPAKGGQVIVPPDLLKQALVDRVPEAPVRGTHLIGIDWGYKGMTALVVVRIAGGYVDVVDYASFSHQLLDDILEELQRFRRQYGARRVYADSSHPFNNAEIARYGFQVNEVNFQQFKEKGVGRLVRLFERGRIRIPRAFGEVVRQLQGWKRDRNGKIVKRDDHFPDALVCVMNYFEDRRPAYSGIRPIFGNLWRRRRR